MPLTDRFRGPLLRTAAFRMAMWQAGLFALMLTALLGVVWQKINHYAESELHDEVVGEVSNLRQAAASGTLPARLRRQLSGHVAASEYYLLTDARQQLIEGNLHYRPTAPGWQIVPLEGAIGADHSDADQVHLLVTHLADGRWLVVGRDNRSLIELGEVLSQSFIELGVLAIALVLLSGGLVGWRYFHCIDTLGARAERVLEGNHELPLIGSGRGDEIDRLATRLNQMLARTQVLMAGMQQVSNNIAHDLRTPLGTLRQRLEASLTRNETGDIPKSVVNQAIDDVDGIQATFSALLRIASVETKQRHSGFDLVDLSALFEHVAETYRPVAEDDGYPFSSDIAAGVQMHGDRSLLTQSLANLIENALHHTPKGTRIVLSLRRCAGGWLGSVTDHGQGIPAALHRHVLGRFVRLESSRSTPGNGLGLALVVAVADLHGIVLQLKDAVPGLRVELQYVERPPRGRLTRRRVG
ncbi:sensor histidine kinase [Rhodanobacter sp. 115]|uniref:sensor histidine kinase n=2 Tax=Rhodanobacter sp. FW021-MT20 TaxID=1162282 RepID=UPI0034E5B25E